MHCHRDDAGTTNAVRNLGSDALVQTTVLGDERRIVLQIQREAPASIVLCAHVVTLAECRYPRAAKWSTAR